MKTNLLKKVIIIAVILFGLVFLNNRFLGNFLQNVFYKVANKPGQFLTGKLQWFSRYGQSFLKNNEVVQDDVKLQEENQTLLAQVAELDSVKKENQLLRDELGVSPKTNFRLLLTRIFNIQKTPLSSTILIDVGKNDGVKKSMPVVTAGNILVGIVDQVFDKSSVVLLLDDPRAKINALVLESGTLVSTAGKLGGNLGLELITNQEDVKEGDMIVTNGSVGLPEALPMAKITKVELGSGNLFKNVEAHEIFDPSLGSELFVITN